MSEFPPATAFCYENCEPLDGWCVRRVSGPCPVGEHDPPDETRPIPPIGEQEVGDQ